MRKLISLVCAAMLCMCCIGLAACGGSSSSGSSAASSAEAPSAADPTAAFIGDWKLAGAETQGVTLAGDFGSMVGVEEGMQLSIQEGGVGVATFGDDSNDFTWVASGDNAITITVASSSDEGSSEAASSDSAASSDAAESSEDDADELLGDSSEPVEFTIEDDVLKGTIESDGQTVTMLFTKDGNLPGALSIDTEKATPITSEADLVGDWKLTGMSMMGMMVYGDADTLSSISGDADTSITFEEGGKCTMSGEELEYSVSEDGAIISESGIDIPVSKLDDAIILDMGTASGMGIDMVFMYTK